ncbi:MAG: hypothetical protein J6I41_09040 [Bacteroidales bacterium]|nr:hypothetical protein [Bacteroidales bacterium]
MKRLGILLACFATLALTSCSLFSAAASSNTVAKASGQNCGAAVQGLYGTYKGTGNIDLSNPTNLNNALALATSYANLKQNKDNADYRKAFTAGLIASSAGLITNGNAAAFVDKMLATAGLSNINSQNIAQTAATASAIISLLKVVNQ